MMFICDAREKERLEKYKTERPGKKGSNTIMGAQILASLFAGENKNKDKAFIKI